MKSVRLSLLIVLLTIFAGQACAGGFDVLLGNALHVSPVVKIGPYDISTPRWETHPLSDSPYFAIRFRWQGHELEMLHDKIYLPDTEHIKGFSLSDGFNFLMLNAPFKLGEAIEARAGLGVVITHPEGTIGDRQIGYPGGPTYRLAGGGGQVALTYRRSMGSGLSVLAEAKVTAAFTHMEFPSPVDSVDIPVTGLHFFAGVGYDF